MARKSEKPHKIVYNSSRTKVFYIDEQGKKHEFDRFDLYNFFGKFMEMEWRLRGHHCTPYWSLGGKLFFVGKLEKIDDKPIEEYLKEKR